MTARPDRARLYSLVPVATIYVTLALAWCAFARWVVPPLLVAERPGTIATKVKHHIDSYASAFLPRETAARWHLFAIAVTMTIVLHLSIVLLLKRMDSRLPPERTMEDARAERRASRWLATLSLAFLTVTLVSGPIHDYHYYLNMWYEVEQGHDPWFVVAGSNGIVPLNAYGPLFNVLALLDWLNPLAPKLAFAYAYILFAIMAIKGFTARRGASLVSLTVLTALFWNPYPWVEIAFRGHFDILVALLCLGAIRAWVGGRDVLAGTLLALGVLVKYFPVVLLPFFAIDRGRIRWKVVLVAVTMITLGMVGSYLLWGSSLFRPLTFAATRGSNFMSIFFFLRGRYSPLHWIVEYPNYDSASSVVLFLGLLRGWSWYRTRFPDFESACLVAVTTTAIFYRTGFPQYHMVPFVLGADWAARNWAAFKDRYGRLLGITGYLGWLAVIDSYYLFIHDEEGSQLWNFVEQTAGVPTLVFGCAFIAAVVVSAGPKGDEPSRPESHETETPGLGVGPSA